MDVYEATDHIDGVDVVVLEVGGRCFGSAQCEPQEEA